MLHRRAAGGHIPGSPQGGVCDCGAVRVRLLPASIVGRRVRGCAVLVGAGWWWLVLVGGG